MCIQSSIVEFYYLPNNFKQALNALNELLEHIGQMFEIPALPSDQQNCYEFFNCSVGSICLIW